LKLPEKVPWTVTPLIRVPRSSTTVTMAWPSFLP
jgi:hypothetical protein